MPAAGANLIDGGTGRASIREKVPPADAHAARTECLC
jgi:hypothetical protein